MGLRDYVPPSAVVNIGTESAPNPLSVRGLSFDDLAKMTTKHGPVLTFMYARFAQEKKKGLTPEVMGEMITLALGQFPEAVAYLIALAADEEDCAPVVTKLGLPKQVELIEKIVGLTFVSEAELKKLVETVTRMLVQTRGAIEAVNSPVIPSVSGNGAFVSR